MAINAYVSQAKKILLLNHALHDIIAQEAMKMISSDVTNKLVSILKNAGCKELFLFGSHVTGSADDNSDIDIGVKGLLPKDFFSIHAQLEEACGKEVDLVDFDEKPKLYVLLNNLGELKKIG